MQASLPKLIVAAGKDFGRDRVLTLAAALAFYTALSLAPLLVLMLWAASLVGSGVEEHLAQQAELLVGSAGRDLVNSVVSSAKEGVRFRGVAGAISIATLALSASAVFAQLQTALNVVWDVRAKPGRGLLAWVRKRILSFAMVGMLAFLMIVSLAASTLVSALQSALSEVLPWRLASILMSFTIFALLFALVFKLLPDVRILWRDVWFGAGVTALLFTAGKHLIGLYLARKGLGSAYGAAGSVVVVLAWVYFSAVLTFFGAELTQAWANAHGRRLEPKEYAVRAQGDLAAQG